jgi:hypothetical protein
MTTEFLRKEDDYLPMTVSISKPSWRGLQALRTRAASARRWVATTGLVASASARAASATPATAAESTPRPAVRKARWRGEVDSNWVLSAMMGALCLIAVCWFFAHGTAATFWLVALITIGFAGVPLGLLALRILRYDDTD